MGGTSGGGVEKLIITDDTDLTIYTPSYFDEYYFNQGKDVKIVIQNSDTQMNLGIDLEFTFVEKFVANQDKIYIFACNTYDMASNIASGDNNIIQYLCVSYPRFPQAGIDGGLYIPGKSTLPINLEYKIQEKLEFNTDYNPSTNKVATMADIPTIPAIPTALSQLTDDSTHRTVTDTEKETWNNKQDALSFMTAPSSSNKVATAADLGGGLPTTSAILKGDGNGGATSAVAGTDYMAASNPTGTGSFSLNRNSNGTIGSRSFACGYATIASGDTSFASGTNTTASGNSAHTEGLYTRATNSYDHAEGYYAVAQGAMSHAEGDWTTASGQGSHAEGRFTKASGKHQHVQGRYNVVDQEGSNAVYADIIGNGTADDVRKNIEATTWTGDKRLKGDVYVGCNDDSTGGTKLAKMSDIPTTLASLTDDATHRVVTDTQVSAWTAKADLASPTFTGTPVAPTAAAGTNTTQIATTAFVKAAVDAAINDALNASY